MTASTPLRVVFLTHSYPRFSGDAAGSFLLTLARALAGENVEVHVLAPAAADLAPLETLDGIPVHRFRYAPQRWETLAYTGTMAETVTRSLPGKLALAGYLWAQRRALRRLVRRLDAHVVHAHWWFPAGLGARRRSTRAGRPLVLTMHGSDVRLALRRRAAHPFVRRVLGSAAGVTVVSRWLAQQASAMAPAVSIEVAPMPVDTSLFHPDLGARSGDGILFVGRLNEQKGLRHLLDALAAMRQPARLHVVGDGPDAVALRDRATALGIASRITWHGPLSREQLAQRYRQAAVAAIPSVNEGLGLVAVEAQLCETPVVAFDSGGLPDVVAHERSGLLVPPDARALATALDRILADPPLAASLGRAGRQRMHAAFAPEAVAARYAAIYRAALEQPHAP